jgi:hypothetical protein
MAQSLSSGSCKIVAVFGLMRVIVDKNWQRESHNVSTLLYKPFYVQITSKAFTCYPAAGWWNELSLGFIAIVD